MAPKKLLIFLFLILFSVNYLFAGRGNSILSIQEGFLTKGQLQDVTSSQYMDIPSRFTGALFISYRYFLTDFVALGFSCGLDNVKGNLTTGPPSGAYYGTGISPGSYVRHSYTLAAPELVVILFKRHRLMVYASAGIGYTFSKIEKVYKQALYESYYNNGVSPLTKSNYPPINTPTNPYYETHNYLNGQVNPISIKYGGRVALFAEWGYGYKGVVSGGVRLRL